MVGCVYSACVRYDIQKTCRACQNVDALAACAQIYNCAQFKSASFYVFLLLGAPASPRAPLSACNFLPLVRRTHTSPWTEMQKVQLGVLFHFHQILYAGRENAAPLIFRILLLCESQGYFHCSLEHTITKTRQLSKILFFTAKLNKILHKILVLK